MIREEVSNTWIIPPRKDILTSTPTSTNRQLFTSSRVLLGVIFEENFDANLVDTTVKCNRFSSKAIVIQRSSQAMHLLVLFLLHKTILCCESLGFPDRNSSYFDKETIETVTRTTTSTITDTADKVWTLISKWISGNKPRKIWLSCSS